MIEGEDLTAEAGNVAAELPELSPAEEIAALKIRISELIDRIAELEGSKEPGPVPKWEDLGHRHTEEEFR